MICVMGVDPGLTGAIAFVHTDAPGRVAVYDMPTADGEVDPHAVAKLIADHDPGLAYIERVTPMPSVQLGKDGKRMTMGATSAFNFGQAYAAVRTAVALSGVPTVLVTPGAWKRAAGVPGGKENKDAARAMALRLFPDSAAHFARKKDHGRAEAALIALHGRQMQDARDRAA